MSPDPRPPSRSAATRPEAVPSRRQMLRLIGGGTVLAAGAGLGACSTSLPEAATRPWTSAGTERELRRFMLAHALLAPNPHNRQPWVADLRQPDRIDLFCDGERLLPETDPYGRQILVGCGAFIELAVIAASQQGVAVRVDSFPNGAPDMQRLPAGTHVARLTLSPAGRTSPDPLFAQITRRHTSKTAYLPGRAVPEPLVLAWQETARRHGLQAGTVRDADGMAALRRVTRQAYEVEMLTSRTWLESARLMRIGPAAIERHRDGISLNGAMPRLAHAFGLFDPMRVPVRGDSSMARVMERWAAFETGSGYLWLSGPAGQRQAQLAAGRAYVRMHLQATQAGVDMHPLSQALQEFAEVQPAYLELHRLLGADPASVTVQMLSRVGYAAQAAQPGPRRPLDELVRA